MAGVPCRSFPPSTCSMRALSGSSKAGSTASPFEPGSRTSSLLDWLRATAAHPRRRSHRGAHGETEARALPAPRGRGRRRTRTSVGRNPLEGGRRRAPGRWRGPRGRGHRRVRNGGCACCLHDPWGPGCRRDRRPWRRGRCRRLGERDRTSSPKAPSAAAPRWASTESSAPQSNATERFKGRISISWGGCVTQPTFGSSRPEESAQWTTSPRSTGLGSKAS